MEPNKPLEFLKTLLSVGAGYKDIWPALYGEMEQTAEDLKNFVVCVPFIGRFNAGKSALLNHFIGQNVLPVDQIPTTCLATELHYGPETTLEFEDEQGTLHKAAHFPQTAEEANDPGLARYVRAICTLPSPNLERLSGIIPVDMAGADSGIEAHTRALFQYLHRGTAFVVVADVQEGTLHPSLAQAIRSLGQTQKNFILALSKCDRSPRESITSVAGQISAQIAALAGQAPPVIETSALDESTPEKLMAALTPFRPESLAGAAFAPTLERHHGRLEAQIRTLLVGLSEDFSELDRKIYEAEQSKREAEAFFEKKRRQVRNEFSGALAGKIVSEVRMTLERQMDSLVEAALEGEHSLSLRVTTLVEQTVLQALRHNIEYQFEAVLNELSQIPTLNTEEIQKTVKSSVSTTISVLKTAMKIFEKGGKMYKVVATTLAVMTNVIAPILEIILIFLPEIIDFFVDREEQRRQRIKSLIRNKMLPEIARKLEGVLRQEIPALGEAALAELEKEFISALEIHETTLRSAVDEKNLQEKEIQDRRSGYGRDLETLKAALAAWSR